MHRVKPKVMTRKAGSLDGGTGSSVTAPHLAAPHTATAEVKNCTPDNVVGQGKTIIAALFTTTIMLDTTMYAAPTHTTEEQEEVEGKEEEEVVMVVVVVERIFREEAVRGWRVGARVDGDAGLLFYVFMIGNFMFDTIYDIISRRAARSGVQEWVGSLSRPAVQSSTKKRKKEPNTWYEI